MLCECVKLEALVVVTIEKSFTCSGIYGEKVKYLHITSSYKAKYT